MPTKHRAPMKPYNVTQPDGPSFAVTGTASWAFPNPGTTCTDVFFVFECIT
jgi:hypothetical protein